MATERIDIIVAENGSRTVKRNLQEVGNSGAKAAQGIGLLKGALLSLGIGASVAGLIRLSDSYTNILNRLRLVTSSTANLSAVNDELFASAQRTRQSYEGTATLYGKLAMGTKNLGVSQKELLGITESVNQAITLSGANTAQAQAAMMQFGQALAGGIMRAEEFNSLVENTPRLAQALADGMAGGDMGKLRALVNDGAVSSAMVVKAMQSEAAKLKGEFVTMAPTIGQSFTVLINSLTRFIGKLNEATGIGAAVANTIIFLANNLDTLAVVAGGLAAAFAWSYISAGVASVLGPMIALQRALGATSLVSALYSIAIKAATGATRGLTMALLANPFTALIAAVTLAVAAIMMFGDEVKVTEDGAVSLKDAFFGALLLIGDLVKVVAGAFLTAWDYTIGAVTEYLASFGISWSDIFSFIWDVTKGVINGVIGMFVFAWNTIKVAWNNFPGFMDIIFTAVLNLAAEAAEAVLNAWQTPLRFISRGLSIVSDEAGAALSGFLDTTSISIPRAKLSGAGRAAGDAILAGAQSALGTDYVGNFMNAAIERGRGLGSSAGEVSGEKGLAQQAGATDGKGGKGDKDGKDSNKDLETRVEYMKQLQDEANSAISQSRIFDSEMRKVQEEVDTVNSKMRDKGWEVLSLDEEIAFRTLIRNRETENRLMGVRDGILKTSKGPQREWEDHLKAAGQLLEKGAISLDDYTRSLRRARMEYLQSKTDMASGLELGKLQVQDQKENVGARVASSYQSEWSSANGAMQELQDRAAALQQLMVDDPINSGQYAQRLRETGLEALILKGNMPDASVFDGMRAGLARFVQDFKGMMPGLSQSWGNFTQTLGDGFANAVGRAIVYGENLGDALKSVAQQAMAELISSLVKLGIQWLIMQVIGQTAQKAMASTASAAGTAVASAWAPAAAMVSLATFGANGVPAGIAIAAVNALSLGLAQVGGGKGFKEGGYTGNVGVSQTAGVVHGREYVFDADATSRLGVPFLDALRAGQVSGYQSGGYVGRRKASGSTSSAMTLGSNGGLDKGANTGGDTLSISIDARGAEAGVEQKIEDALMQALPVFLAKSRKQEAKVDMQRTRQKIGG